LRDRQEFIRMLKLYFFGPPRVELDDVPVHIGRRKALALLVYLALTDRPHSRDALATLFYPDLSQSRARAYFRRDLGALNTQLQGDWLEADYETVGLNESAEVWIDVSQFRNTLTGRDDHPHPNNEICPDCLPLLTKALELYEDHFLAGFSLPDAPEFDEWHFFEIEKLRQELATAIEQLVTGHMVRGQYKEAIPSAQRLLKLDPLHEPAHRYLMKLYALSGQQAAALRQYENCLSLLEDELGVEPEGETTKLYQDIKSRRFEQVAAGVAGFQSTSTDQMPADKAQSRAIDPALSRPVADNLPAFLLSEDEPDSEPHIFVAREHELARLEEALDSARNGRGQILFVVGGAGRGKTTLIREFARRAEDSDPDLVIVTGYCKAIVGIGDPYLPFREALTMLTGDVEAKWAGGLIGQKHARQLWELMPITLPALVKHAPDLINRFVSAEALRERAAKAVTNNSVLLNQVEPQVIAGLSGPLDQTAIFTQYASVIKAVASQQPLLLIIEDLHWVDAASSALLFHLSRELGESRVILLGTYRPEEVALDRPISSRSGPQTQHPLVDILSELKRQHGDVWLDLGDLASTEGRHFVEAYLDKQPNRLDKGFREALFQRTQGHALFTVELVRAMQERGDLLRDEDGYLIKGEKIDWTKLPVKVEGIIERRIKRLPESLQSILTTASIEGETFTVEVVARVQQLDERTLVQQLSRELDKQHQLVKAQSVEWLIPGQQRLSIYRFQHQLFQHYLYHRLDEVERGYLHEAIGNSLEELYQGRTGEVASQLAHHFQAAGMVVKAIRYLTEAGDAAAAVHANIEAVAHYGRAVELAEQAKISTEELAHLYVSLGGQLMVTKGDGAPEVGQSYGRALELYEFAGESSQRFAALRGLTLYHKLRGESEIAHQLSEEMLTLANSLCDPVLIVEACYAMGSHYFYSGDFPQAQVYLEQGIKSYDRRQHRSLILLYGQDPGVANLCYACLTVWLLGYPGRALQRSTEALALAHELTHPYSLAMAYTWSAWVHFYRREEGVVLERTEAAISLSTKHNFTIFLGVGTFLRGWALIEQGKVEEGISEVQQGIATGMLAIGLKDLRPEFQAVLADSYHKLGQSDRALGVLAKAVTVTEESPNLEWGQSEIYRLKGEVLLLNKGHTAHAEAETCFRHAMDIAHRQGAKSLELRAVMSLSRLWQSLGKKENAHQILSAIYSWFTEGFDTADLKEARELLKELELS